MFAPHTGPTKKDYTMAVITSRAHKCTLGLKLNFDVFRGTLATLRVLVESLRNAPYLLVSLGRTHLTREY